MIDNEKNKENVKKEIEFVRENNGIDYAVQTTKSYTDKAMDALNKLHDSQSKIALEGLVDFVIERKN